MVLGTRDERVTFVYAAHGASRITFTSTDPDMPLCVKISDVDRYATDDNQVEYADILPEWLIPRVYGLYFQLVFGKNISMLLVHQEQMTVRKRMTLFAQTPVTAGLLFFYKIHEVSCLLSLTFHSFV